MAEDITTRTRLTGDVAPLQRSLRTAESAVKASADRINRTRADVKVGVDMKKLDRDLADMNRKLDKVFRDAERRQAASAAKSQRATTQLGKTFAAGSNPTSAIGGLGGTALQGLVIAKAAEVAISATNQVLDFRAAQRSAQRTGNLDAVLEEQKSRESALTSIPFVGALGKGIRDLGQRLDPTKDGQEALDILKEQTAEQEKQNDRRQKGIDLQKELNKQADAQLTALKRANEDRTASPAQQGLNAARRAFLDTANAQDEARGSLPLTASQLAVRRELGANVGRARREVGHARTRQFVQEQVDQQEESRQTSERTGQQQRARREAAKRSASFFFQAQIDAQAERDERLTAETETKSLELRASGRDRQADELEIENERRHGIEGAAGDQGKINRANRQADAKLKAIERDAVERRAQGAAGTRIAELESRGQSGQARVVGIEEELREALKAAGQDPELKDQAKRRATAELQALEREVDAKAGRQRAETGTAFQDLRGRFSGPNDPNAETPNILKGTIAKLLGDIKNNTAGGAVTT